MMGWHHDWQEHFDIMDFHFCSIIQAEFTCTWKARATLNK